MQRHLISRRPATAFLVALVASAAIAACGGSSPSGVGAASITKAGLEFAACVRAHGVPDFPDPIATAGATQTNGTPTTATPVKTLSESTEVVQKAQEACQKYAAAAEGPVVSGAQLAKLKAGALAYAKCIRAHGVPNFPDPTVEAGPGGHGAGITPPFGTGAQARAEAQSPALQAAIKTCSPLVDNVTPGLPSKNG
jgi:hypothetical protein